MTYLVGVTFPDCVSYGTNGGPRWLTDVITLKSGHERRNQEWEDTRYEYDAALGVKTYDDLRQVIDVFQQARGKLHSFRWKDWLEFEATDEYVEILDDGTGQASKIYGDYVRKLTKLKAGVTLVGATLNSVDLDTGIITFTGLSSGTYTSIDRTNPANVNDTAHGLSTGDRVRITGESGMTEVNNKSFTIEVTGPDDYELVGVDATGYGADGTGGTITIYPVGIGWSGEFDVHVRFDTDTLPVRLDAYNLGSASIPIIEDREE